MHSGWMVGWLVVRWCTVGWDDGECGVADVLETFFNLHLSMEQVG